MSDSNLDHVSLWASINCPDSGDENSVNIWKVDLDSGEERVRALEPLLSPDEAARAGRFHVPSDRRRFIAARGSLRLVLGEYLHVKAVEIRFAYTPNRKPVLAYPTLVPEEALCFNVSHSASLALIAVTWRRAVGIDIERKRTDFDPESLAKRFFSSPEYAALCEAPPQEKHSAFLRCWVCKEAYLKALGTGLNHPLNDFAVSLEDHSVRSVSSAGADMAAAPYRIHPFSPDPDYVAAMAVEVR